MRSGSPAGRRPATRAPGGRPREGRAADRDDLAGLLGQRHEVGRRGRRPRAGCSQRTRASAAATRPVSSATIGWYSTMNCSRSTALQSSSLRPWRRTAASPSPARRPRSGLALGLRLVHRDVGVADQLVAVAGDLEAGGDADAEVHREQLSGGVDRQLERLEDAVETMRGRLVGSSTSAASPRTRRRRGARRDPAAARSRAAGRRSPPAARRRRRGRASR